MDRPAWAAEPSAETPPAWASQTPETSPAWAATPAPDSASPDWATINAKTIAEQPARDAARAELLRTEIAANPESEPLVAKELGTIAPELQAPPVEVPGRQIKMEPDWPPVVPKKKRTTAAVTPPVANLKPPSALWFPGLPPAPTMAPGRAPRELGTKDTLPGFLFEDLIPGAIESQLGGLWNMGAQGLTAIPALGAAALSDDKDGQGFIDRFKEAHAGLADPLTYRMRTATGEKTEEVLGEGIEAALDWVGGHVADLSGPEAGAYTKGALAAILAGAGVLKLKSATAPKPGPQLRVEPRVDTLPEAPGRAEPTMRSEPAMQPRTEPASGSPIEPLRTPEPALGAEPTLPAAPRVETAPIQKPRVRVPAEEVRGRTYLSPEEPAVTAAAPDAPPAPKAATLPEPQQDTGMLAQPVDPEMFRVERTPEPLPTRTLTPPERPEMAAPEARIPEAPRDPTPEPALPEGGLRTPEPDKSYIVRNVPSDVRKGGVAGGEQYVKVPQLIHWEDSPTAKLDRALFDAGKQFKLGSTDPKVKADAVRNQAKAFDDLQTEARAFFQDARVPPEVREAYADLLTADRSQIDRAKLQEAASAYNVQLSTLLKDARRANEGQRVRIVAPSRVARSVEPPPAATKAPPKHSPQSPEQVEALRKVREDYDSAIQHAKSWEGVDPETAAKMRKGAGMRKAAEERKITGNLTAKEAAAADLRRRTINYRGKPVEVNGQLGNVESVSFGKVKVKLDDGTTVRVDPADVISRDKGPGGTLSMNPFGEATRGVLDLMQRGNKTMQRALNPAQAMPDEVGPAAAMGYEAARSFYTAREAAQWDRAQKSPDLPGMQRDFNDAMAEVTQYMPNYDPGPLDTIGDVIRATERARIRTAERKLQSELIEGGYAVAPVRGEPLPEGFVVPQNYSAFTLPDGRVLALDADAAPVLEQMVSGYDWAAERRYYASVGGKIEATSHGLTGALLLLPTFHAVTAGGRMAPAAINLPKNNLLKFGKSAVDAMRSREQMQDMMKHGVTFFPKRQTFDPEGAHVGLVERTMKKMGLGGVYDGYQWFHNDVLANTVNWGETMYYQWRLEQLQKGHKGDISPAQLETYKYMAGRDASLIAANLAKEEAGRTWARILGSVAFSRGLQVNTVRMATRALEGDRVLQAVAQKNGLTVEQAKAIMNQNREFLAKQLVKDYVVMQVTANVLNYFATSAVQEPGGKEGGHFIWDNQGSDKMQMVLPTNIFVGVNTDKEGKKQGVYISSPFRSARDVVEYAMIPFELAHGERARVLRNKASVPLKLAAEHMWTGEDYAGRPLRGGWAAGANIAGSLTPAPFEEVPRYGAEALRLGSAGYFAEGLEKIFNPSTFVPEVLGMQPKTLKPNPEVSMLQQKQLKLEEAVRARASRLKQQLYGMTPERRQEAIESLMQDAEAAHMDARAKRGLRKMLENPDVSRGAEKQAERYLEIEPDLRKNGFPMIPEAPAEPGEI